MNDYQIRIALLAGPLAPWRADPSCRVVEEAGLNGGAVDVLVVSTVLHGYEIKSDVDTLVRLPRQVSAFDAVCHHMTLVTTPKYADKALVLIPSWWGLLVAEGGPGAVEFLEARPSIRGLQHDPSQIVSHMWVPELRDALKDLGQARGTSAMNHNRLMKRFQEVADQEKQVRMAIAAFKRRAQWGLKVATPEATTRGGVMREVTSRGTGRRVEDGTILGSHLRDEVLSCGHTVTVPLPQPFQKNAKRRRCLACRTGAT